MVASHSRAWAACCPHLTVDVCVFRINQIPFCRSEMRDNMKSKRANRAEGDEEEEEEEEEGKGPAIATTAADSSALAMVSCRITSLRQGGQGG